MFRANSVLVTVSTAVLCVVASAAAEQEEALSALEFRQILSMEKGGMAETGTAIPMRAVRVFVYEGKPLGVRVTGGHIAVDYGRSGVLFDGETGEFVRRLTVADGWPGKRPEGFPPPPETRPRRLAGPGVLVSYEIPRPGEGEPSHRPAAEVAFDRRLWRAMQPTGFLDKLRSRVDNDWNKLRETFGSWTGILRVLNAESFVEAVPEDGQGAAERFTMAEGLAGNIVTHLVVADGKLWAACVDIYDPERKEWGPGGLCRFDPQTRRWERLETIDRRGVRWVTLLQSIGNDLWVGFREGSGVAGDQVSYGMGTYHGQYGPEATAIVLARLSDGGWKSYATEPLPGSEKDPPKEAPRKLALLGEKVLLFSRPQERPYGGWDVRMAAYISLLDLAAGEWRRYDVEKDFGAHVLHEMIVENGEVLACSDQGVHRWLPGTQEWAFLDPSCALRNPMMSAAELIGDELWIGYTNQSFGVMGRQGISRFNEETGQWSYAPPEEIGTASPVRGMVVMPGGDVWVLFQKRRNLMSARAEFFLYGDEAWDATEGVGRLSNGKWEFPVKLEGVPESRQRERKGPDGVQTWTEKLPIRHIARIGAKLFVSNGAGVYVGPGKWTAVFETPVPERPVYPDDAPLIRPSEDGKTLTVSARGETGDVRHGRYDPETGELTFSEAASLPPHRFYADAYASGYLLYAGGNRRWHQSRTRVPTRKEGDWAIGELSGRSYHAIVETPWAVWIASEGELIRLDRKELAEWIGGGDD